MKDELDRKLDHIKLTDKSQTGVSVLDKRFYYEPLLVSHDEESAYLKKFRNLNFLGKKMNYPIWISSMTGGTGKARHINQNLAKVCAKYKLGMGLGSCRKLIESNEFFDDFYLRPIIGDDLPFWANIGIAQLEQSILSNEIYKIEELVTKLRACGLIVHINPLQEWFQPEGDRLQLPALTTIKKFLDLSKIPVIIKEVGQGFGPRSLEALMKLPIVAVDFASFGGTNFSKLEKLRNNNDLSMHEGLTTVGHSALEMVNITNEIIDRLGDKVLCKSFIISGGIRTYLDGLYLTSLSKGDCVFAMAQAFLDVADQGFEQLDYFVGEFVKGLEFSSSILSVRE